MTEAQLDTFSKFIQENRKQYYLMNNGDCVGADGEAQDLCVVYFCTQHIRMYPAFELGHHKRVGVFTGLPHVVYMHKVTEPLKRNRLMVDDASLVVATPAENSEVLRSGTWATIRYAVTRGKKLHIIMPDGKIEQ